REERVRACGFGCPPRERVLHDREARTVLDQLRAQLVDLRHGQSAVVGDQQRLCRTQPLGQLGDHSLLLFFLHLLTSSNESSPHTAGSLKEAKTSFTDPPREGFRLAAASCLRRRAV